MSAATVSKLLFRRDDDDHEDHEDDSDEGNMKNLLVTLVVLIAFGIVLGGSLFALNRHRKQRKADGTLPTYEETTRGHTRLTITTNRDSVFIFSEKQGLIENGSPMPLSPDSIPEIRITDVDSVDSHGQRASTHIVVLGEAGIAYTRPVADDKEPPSYVAYNPNNGNDRYTSIDIERIGGLKEVS